MARTDLDPVEIRVAQNMVSVLAAVAAGDDYYHTIRHAELSKGGWFNPPVFTAAVVIPRGTPADPPGESLVDTAIFDVDYQVVAVHEKRTEAAEWTARLYADIHHALMVDVTRGDLAESTTPVNHELLIPVDDADQHSLVEATFRVRFRTEQDDLTIAV